MREKTAFEIEIYGLDDPIAPGIPVACVLPMESDLYPYQPGNGTADATCAQLLDDQFGSEVTGLTPSEFRKAVTVTATTSVSDNLAKSAQQEKRIEELNAKFEALVSSEVNKLLIPLQAARIVTEKKAALMQRAPIRKREIEKWLQPLRAMFWRMPGDQREAAGIEDRLSSLSEACEKFVTDAIISET